MAGQLDDWIAETPESIAARLEGAKEAQRQTRFTLGIMAIISMMTLITSYNAYLSFDSRWILQRVKQGGPALVDKSNSTIADALTFHALQDWARSRNATIGLLGIRVSVDDAPVLGTVSLFVTALWLLLVTRRENQTVTSLLRDTDTPRRDDGPASLGDSPRLEIRRPCSQGQRWLIFHTIAAHNLFLTLERSISGIQPRLSSRPLAASVSRWTEVPGKAFWVFARDFFFQFPAFASLAVFALDRLSYFRPDPFLPGLGRPGTSAPMFYESAVVFLACWIPLFLCCLAAARNSKATDHVLRAYGDGLRSDLLRQQPRTAVETGRRKAHAIVETANKLSRSAIPERRLVTTQCPAAASRMPWP
jgi:hypothetical protein